MRCNQYREQILTGYLDGELNKKSEKRLERHLKDCRACRELVAAVRSSAAKPFKNLRQVRPPEAVWGNIKERIEEPKPSRVRPTFEAFLRGVLSLTNPVPAMIMAVLIVVTAWLTTARLPSVEIAGSNDVQYIASLIDPDDASSEGYGTELEEYFL